MNRLNPRIMRLVLPAVIAITVVVLVNFYLRSEDATEIGFLGGDYSAFIGTTLLFVIFIAFVQIMLRRGSRGRYDKMNAYLQAERKANLSRKRDMGASFVIAANFPEDACTDGDSKLSQLQDKARAASQQKMMKLNMSNIEIKQSFGPQNLDNVALGEANFNKYVQTLTEWADELQARGNNEAACAVLQEAVNVGADTSKVYMALAGLYHAERRTPELTALRDKAHDPEFLPGDSITRSKIQTFIEDLL
ncbi:MAG: hypothetical protein FWD98_08320 [Defluviitaleaceae bacterium]|nr:hypothetical protein [Defluviitaleaceae bacterium]